MAAVDFVIIGAGIAGASVGYQLSRHGRVVVLEQEPRVGYHSTGRSAALFSETYGLNSEIRVLTAASRGFFESPGRDFAPHPLLRRRGTMYIAPASTSAGLRHFHSVVNREFPAVRQMSADSARELVPILRADLLDGAVYDPHSADIDVNALHQGFLRGLKSRDGMVVTDVSIETIKKVGAEWIVSTATAMWRAPSLINAAGAWADTIASQAGIAIIGIRPFRRTMVIVPAPAELNVTGWPLVTDLAETFYFKPESGSLLLSPADEVPTEPCDAQPQELDIAVAIDRVEALTSLNVSKVKHKWAGLRTFSPDRMPVVGFDPITEGFFWLAGLGGTGIQTAPALSQIAAAEILGMSLHSSMPCIARDVLSPARFR